MSTDRDIHTMIMDCPKCNGPISLEECNECKYNKDPWLSDNHSWINCNYGDEE